MSTFILDLLAAFFGIVSVVFAVRNSALNYYFGLLSIVLYILLLYRAGIYGDILLNLFYAVFSIYGLWNWSRKNQHQRFVVQISSLSVIQWRISGIAFLFTWGCLYFFLLYFTDSEIIFWDSLTTALGFIGMYWMSLRKKEYWLFFIIANAVSCILYLYRNLPFSACQFVILNILAVQGYRRWSALLKVTTSKEKII